MRLQQPSSVGHSLLAGLGAGAIAALAAALLSLPLRSPDDVFFNTGSVAIGALLAGLGAGAAWWAVRRRTRPPAAFGMVMLAAFVAVVVLTIVVQALPSAPFDRLVSFVVPLAALTCALLAALTPLLAQPAARAQWAAPVIWVVVPTASLGSGSWASFSCTV